jgi:hypothetical protein
LSEAQIAKADMPKGPSLKGDAAIAAHATAGGMNFVAKSMMGANKQTPEERMNESPLKAALQGALGSGAELLKSAGGSVAEGLSGGLVEGEGASEAVGHLGSMAGWGVRGISKATMNATKPAADQQRLRRHVANLYTEKGKGELTEHHTPQVMPEFGAALRARPQALVRVLALLGAKASDHAHGIAIHRHRQGSFCLGPIHGGVGGRIDHQGGSMQIEQRPELVLQRRIQPHCGQIQLRPTHHQQRALGQPGGGQPLHGTGHLTAAANQQDRIEADSH